MINSSHSKRKWKFTTKNFSSHSRVHSNGWCGSTQMIFIGLVRLVEDLVCDIKNIFFFFFFNTIHFWSHKTKFMLIIKFFMLLFLRRMMCGYFEIYQKIIIGAQRWEKKQQKSRKNKFKILWKTKCVKARQPTFGGRCLFVNQILDEGFVLYLVQVDLIKIFILGVITSHHTAIHEIISTFKKCNAVALNLQCMPSWIFTEWSEPWQESGNVYEKISTNKARHSFIDMMTPLVLLNLFCNILFSASWNVFLHANEREFLFTYANEFYLVKERENEHLEISKWSSLHERWWWWHCFLSWKF